MFEARVANDCNDKVNTLRTDNGGECLSNDFKKYMKEKGIRHELTAPYSPQQNGVAERMNRTLVESARAMISHSNVRRSYWAEAISTASYVRNRLPSSVLPNNKSPVERWSGRKPNLDEIRTFGCIAYAHVPKEKRSKLDVKAQKLRFVGYSNESKAYRLIDEGGNNKVIISRDVIFHEDCFKLEEQRETTKQDEEEPEVRRSTRNRKSPERYVANHTVHLADQTDEPRSMKEAMDSSQANEWKEATDSEYNSLIKNRTRDLIPLREGKNLVDYIEA